MGLLARVRRFFASGSWGPEDDRWYSPGGAFYGGIAPSAAGVPVDSETALRLLTVHNCVRVLAQSVAQLPLHLLRQDGRTKARATEHPLYRLLHDQPNSWMTASEFWGMAMAHIALRGNFYAYKLQAPGRPLVELIPLRADAVLRVEQHPDYSLTYHTLTRDRAVIPIPGERIMHLRGLVLDGVVGLNPIECARDALGIGLASEQFLGRYFAKGLHPGAIFRHPLPLSAPAHANLRDQLKKKYEGLGHAWELMLVDEGMGVEFPSIKLVDAQFLELGRFKQSEICGMFRVPLMLVNANDAPTTYASAEQFMLSFVVHTLTPLLVNIEQAIVRDLIPRAEQGTLYPKFAMAGLLRGDTKSRFEAYQIGINSEILSPNEARDLEDLNPYPGGDEYRTRTSTVRTTGADATTALAAHTTER